MISGLSAELYDQTESLLNHDNVIDMDDVGEQRWITVPIKYNQYRLPVAKLVIVSMTLMCTSAIIMNIVDIT